MLQSITNILQSASMGPAALQLAFLLGLTALKWLSLKFRNLFKKEKRGLTAVRWAWHLNIAGILLVGAGFYLLATFQ